MKTKKFILSIILLCFSISSLAEEALKASEMPKPPSEPSSEKAKELAHKRVEDRKKTLLKKIKAGDSPADVSNAKAQLQIDRVQANRQDYLDEQKEKPEQKRSP